MEKKRALADSLDEIVRELPAYPKRQMDSDIQIIIVDPKTGEMIYERSLNIFRKFRFFELNLKGIIFNVSGPVVTVNYPNATNPLEVTINYDVKIAPKGAFKLARLLNKTNKPLTEVNLLIRQIASTYAFQREDFVPEFNTHKNNLIAHITEECGKSGLEVKPYIYTNITETTPAEFLNIQQMVTAKTNDGQVVEIQHDLALTLSDPIKYALSGIEDMKVWSKNKLDQFTSNAIIEMRYADILVDMDKSIIKDPMKKAAGAIGYELRQLISLPGMDNEKFNFDTADEATNGQRDYSTKDTKFKISLSVIVKGRLDLHSDETKEHIKPGFDIIASMKKVAIEAVKTFTSTKTPDECFLELNQLEIDLLSHIRSALTSEYGFNDLHLQMVILESNLSKRFDLLQARPYGIGIDADFKERNFELWFRVVGIAKDGWYRFRANKYEDTAEELKDIARLVQNSMTSAMLRTGEINGTLIVEEFKKVQTRVAIGFGLEITLHDFHEGVSIEESHFINGRKLELEERSRRNEHMLAADTNELTDLLDKRQLSRNADDSEEVIRKLDERIEAAKTRNTFSKERFIRQTNDNDFLLPAQPQPGDKKNKHHKKT